MTCAPDGYQRYCLAFNGTVPGPQLTADWGDTLVIHVTNNMGYNGTSIHWHGVRQLNTVDQDGVPGVSQCPIAPGETFTYEFQVTQYGSTWYHSHFSLQYADGLFGPLIFNGPATADYDEDLGLLFVGDWSHTEMETLWYTARQGAPPSLENGLLNGTNTYDCSGSTNANCLGNGTKFEMAFESGTTYRLRVINVATEGHLDFSIDGHSFTVIATDFVPIVPFETDSVLIGIGQRYDLIITANQTSGDYWIRGGWQTACANNQNAANITGILRYDSSSTSDPTTTGLTPSTYCGDEPMESLVPWVPLNVTNIPNITTEDLSFTFGDYFTWTINSSSLYLNWSDPTLLQITNNEDIFPTDYNVVSIEVCSIKSLPIRLTSLTLSSQKTTSEADEWALLVVQDLTGIGLVNHHP